MNADKKTKRPHERFNPIPWLIALGVILAIALGTFIVWKVRDYRENYREIYEFEYVDGNYYDSENGITYVEAPYCYTYALKSKEEYATIIGKDDYKLFYMGYKTVDDKGKEEYRMDSPKKMLANATGSIYYDSSKVTLPEPCDFPYDITYACDNKGMLIATHELDKVQTRDLLEEHFASTNLYTDGSAIFDLNFCKELRVCSDTYKSVHLVFTVYSDNTDHYYLYLNNGEERSLTLIGDANAEVFREMAETPTEEKS